MITHSDIKSKGLYLTQSEAQAIHSKVNGIALGHINDGIVYPGETESDKPKGDPLKEYYAELQVKNCELLKENAELKFKIAELSVETAPSFIEGGVFNNSSVIIKGKRGRKAKV